MRCWYCGSSDLRRDSLHARTYTCNQCNPPPTFITMMSDICPNCNSRSCSCPPKDPFTQMQDDMRATWDKLPKSARLTLYQLGYTEGFRVGTDLSYQITKAWRDEQKK